MPSPAREVAHRWVYVLNPRPWTWKPLCLSMAGERGHRCAAYADEMDFTQRRPSSITKLRPCVRHKRGHVTPSGSVIAGTGRVGLKENPINTGPRKIAEELRHYPRAPWDRQKGSSHVGSSQMTTRRCALRAGPV